MASPVQIAALPTLTELLRDPTRISALPRDMIADLRGQIAKLDTLLLSCVLAPSAAPASESSDRLLTTAEAAQKLSATKDWLYRNANTLPFVVRVGKKNLRFSEAGMNRYIRLNAGRNA